MNTSTSPSKHFRNCPFCEAICGLELTLDGGEIRSIRGDPQDPASRGHLCPKSQALAGLRADPDRVRRPLRRRGRDFEEIGWDAAIDEVCGRLSEIRKQQGPDSVGFYFGNPLGHRPGLSLYLPVLLRALATKQNYWVGPLDQSPKLMSTLLMFGMRGSKSLPDIDRTDHLVIIGANPVVSNGSLVIAPGFRERMRAIQGRGGKVVVIDPRRTETAAAADRHVAIRPGTDALLLMAMVETLFAEDLVRIGRLADLVDGLATLRDAARGFPPDRVARVCGVDPHVIRQLARDFAAAPSAVIYGRLGTCVQDFGSVCNWLIDALNILTGNLDRPGGAMFQPGAPFSARAMRDGAGQPIGRWRSRVRGLPEFVGMLPAAVLAEEILEPGEGQVKAFITLAGNPVLSHPNGRRIDAALASLEFMASIDIYVNETTRHAQVILPSRDYLEESDFPAAISHSMVRNYVKWSPPLYEADAESLSDATILTRLAAGLRGVPPAQVEDEMLDTLLRAVQAGGRPECRALSLEEMRREIGDEPGGDRLFDVMLRAGEYGDAFGRVPGGISLAKLRDHPHGLDLGPLAQRLPGMLGTPDGKIHIAPDLLMQDLERLGARLEQAEDPNAMLLIGRRDPRSKNSWLHNVPALAKGKDRCAAMIHPLDAERHGLADGDDVELATETGRVVAPVTISADIMPGVVSLPHGYGHGGEGTRQQVAASKPGASANDLIGEWRLDVPSGSSVLNGVPVTLSRRDRTPS